MRIRNEEDTITIDVLEEALDEHILIALQRKYTPELFERIMNKRLDTGNRFLI